MSDRWWWCDGMEERFMARVRFLQTSQTSLNHFFQTGWEKNTNEYKIKKKTFLLGIVATLTPKQDDILGYMITDICLT